MSADFANWIGFPCRNPRVHYVYQNVDDGTGRRSWDTRWVKKMVVLFHQILDRRLKLELRDSKIISGAGLPAFRELDDALGLTEMAGRMLTDSRTGTNCRHSLIAQFRQAEFGSLAGYVDVNDAVRACTGPDREPPATRTGAILTARAARGG